MIAWWRHQMETYSALLALCEGNSPVTSEFPSQRPVTRSFDVFCTLRLNEWLRKQSWDWWSETSSVSLWRQCNDCKPNVNFVATSGTTEVVFMATVGTKWGDKSWHRENSRCSVMINSNVPVTSKTAYLINYHYKHTGNKGKSLH